MTKTSNTEFLKDCLKNKNYRKTEMQHTAIGSDAQKQKIQPKFPSRAEWTKFDLEKIKSILGKTSSEAWR